jgi:hypothetical protein
MHVFTDQYGEHKHETSVPGRAYDPSAPITCTTCLYMLDSRMSEWLKVLTVRHKLPDNFWTGYKYSWE